MRRPPRAIVPPASYAGSVGAIRTAILKELRRIAPIQYLLYKPTIAIKHLGPADVVITLEGMSYLSTKQFTRLVEVMNDAAPPYAACVLTLGHKRG